MNVGPVALTVFVDRGRGPEARVRGWPATQRPGRFVLGVVRHRGEVWSVVGEVVGAAHDAVLRSVLHRLGTRSTREATPQPTSESCADQFWPWKPGGRRFSLASTAGAALVLSPHTREVAG